MYNKSEECCKRKTKTMQYRDNGQSYTQTLSNATVPIDKIHPLSKIVVTFKQMLIFLYFMRFEMPLQYSQLSNWMHHPKLLRLSGAVTSGDKMGYSPNQQMNEWISYSFCEAAHAKMCT